MQTASDFIAALTVDDSLKAAQMQPVLVALMPWLQQAPAVEVHQLARALLVANTRWHVVLHDTLSWLAEGDWPALVAAALQSAQVRGSMSEAERTDIARLLDDRDQPAGRMRWQAAGARHQDELRFERALPPP